MQSIVSFRAVRLTHQKASVEIRELIHLSEEISGKVLADMREMYGVTEGIVFSTCNRTEVYYIHEKDLSKEIIQLLCSYSDIGNSEAYYPFFEIIEEEKEAAQKLFEVSMGLESTILGDLQISNQIKKAYIISNDLGMAQAYLHRLLHTIFHANKRVHQETPFRDGAASVSYASAELAQQLTQHLLDPSALVLGIGEMGSDVALSLDKDDFGRIALTNRTQSKAEGIAKQASLDVVDFNKLEESVKDFDVILSCVSVKEPLLKADMFPKGGKPVFIIDLCVPRSIEKEMENCPHIICYGVDEITSMTDKTLERRKEAIPMVKAIIEEEITGFLNWRTQLSISPTIQRIKEALDEIRNEELARHAKNASESELKLLREVTSSMIQRIIKVPVLQLKEACKRGDQDSLIEVLHDIFNLERTRTEAK